MLKDILLDNRSYRSFDPRVRLTKAQLMDMIAVSYTHLDTRCAYLEFVREDSVEQFLADAAVLKELL